MILPKIWHRVVGFSKWRGSEGVKDLQLYYIETLVFGSSKYGNFAHNHGNNKWLLATHFHPLFPLWKISYKHFLMEVKACLISFGSLSLKKGGVWFYKLFRSTSTSDKFLMANRALGTWVNVSYNGSLLVSQRQFLHCALCLNAYGE